MTRWARAHRVFYIEELVASDDGPCLSVRQVDDRIWVVVPQLPASTPPDQLDAPLARLLTCLLADYDIRDFISWYYTPMPIAHSAHVHPLAVVYDCMDELAAFAAASPELPVREA